MQQQYDLIVVGGGLAGNCLALCLQNSGLKVLIIEAQSREQRHDSPAGDRALALAQGTAKMLDALGVWEQVKNSATAIKTIHISDQGHFGKTRLDAKKEKVDALGYVITAREIEHFIADQVDQTDIEQICPAKVIGLMSGPDQTCVSIKYNDESLNLNAKLLVGADGGQSTIRKLLEISQQTTEYHQCAIVTTIQTKLSHQKTAYERFTSSGPLALLPVGKNQMAVVWTRTTEQTEELMSLSDELFIAQLQACFGYRLGELSLVAVRRAFPLKLICADQMVSGRNVIIGNAVHQLHPVAGQGFNLALRDVVQLAEMINTQHQQGDDIGATEFLQSYSELRIQDQHRVINFTDNLVKIFSNDWLPVAAARNVGLLALDHISNAKSLLSRHAMGLSGRLPRVGNRQTK